MDTSIFREYDIRGIYPTQLSLENAKIIGAACGKIFNSGMIVVAHDGRTSSPAIEQAFIEGMRQVHPESELAITRVGLSTTPMFYFLVNELKARGGVMITASHNPKEYNGMKIVGEGGGQYSGYDIKSLLA